LHHPSCLPISLSFLLRVFPFPFPSSFVSSHSPFLPPSYAHSWPWRSETQIMIWWQECGKAFGEKSNLVLHMSTTHRKSRRHQCPHCPSAFLQQHSLKTHVESVHQKLRPHVCDVCGASAVPSASYIHTTTFRKKCTSLVLGILSVSRPRVFTKVPPQTAPREAACEHLT
jgi:hypothetical protein